MADELIIEREFEAPIEKVWRFWTVASDFKKWHGPKLFSCPVSKIDFRVGGRYLHCMHGEKGLPPEFLGKEFWSTGIYAEIVPPESGKRSSLARIIATDSFADKNGKIVPASFYGMKGNFPLELVVDVEFERINHNKTRMTLIHTGMPKGEHQEGAKVGWNESLDKLEEVLAK